MRFNKIMKLFGILLLHTLVVFGVYSQSKTLEGEVFDSVYRTPLLNAVVMINKNKAAVFTDENGKFTVVLPAEISMDDSLSVYMPDYELKRISLRSEMATFAPIYLQPIEKEDDIPTFLGGVGFIKPSAFTQTMDRLIALVMDDWYALGNRKTNKLDVGRIQTIPSYNHVEGVRLRLGVATTARLFPHFFMKGYLAYGFKDNRLKYRAEAIFAFNNRVYHDGEYPKNNLSLSHENDVYAAGEIHPRHLNDELLLTYRRSKNTMMYRRFTELNFEKEHLSGFAYNVWMRSSTFTPAPGLSFHSIGQHQSVLSYSDLHTSTIGMQWRYAFGESFKQKRRKRTPLIVNKPVLFLSHTVGIDGLLCGTVPYHRTEISVQNRFIFGDFAHLDAVAEVQKIWNLVPFPLLLFPNQRNSYLIENNPFYLMRGMEFVGDEQYSARFTFVGDKMFLARVPMLRKWEVKELLSVRASLSSLSDKNIPTAQNGLFLFPEGTDEMGKTPYIEGSIGITNILGLIRLEYVHRFTYRDHPNAIKGLVRVDIPL